MRRRSTAIPLVAVVLWGVIGLSACSSSNNSSGSSPPPAATSTDVPVAPPPPAAALPPPNTLTDVLYRLADSSVPGADKVGLVEHGTAGDAEALDKFGRALADGGFTPLTFEATDLAWSESDPGNVVATITAKAANPPSGGNFTFPMEFTPLRNTWQLTRQTVDLLLQLGQAPTATPPR